MPFGFTTTATDFPARQPWQVRLLYRLFWFIPRANPDNEPLFPLVRRWALEINEEGKPVREVGLGEGGTVLFRAPHRRNFGMWTDSPVTFSPRDLEPMDKAAFEQLWQSAQGDGA